MSHSFSNFSSFCWMLLGPIQYINSYFSVFGETLLLIIAFFLFLILDCQQNRGTESEGPSTIKILKGLPEDLWINCSCIFIFLKLYAKYYIYVCIRHFSRENLKLLFILLLSPEDPVLVCDRTIC